MDNQTANLFAELAYPNPLWQFEPMLSNPSRFERFLATAEPAELGPGPRKGVQPRSALEEQLGPLLKSSALSDQRQQLIRALVLLWHDHLDPAHAIAQSIDTPDGAFVHGIVHRREPDFSNAAYWFRRVGAHPAFARMAADTGMLLKSHAEPGLAKKLVDSGAWDPFAFLDECAAASNQPESVRRLLRQIQALEFGALLEHFQG
jgi:hypothetical protein